MYEMKYEINNIEKLTNFFHSFKQIHREKRERVGYVTRKSKDTAKENASLFIFSFYDGFVVFLYIGLYVVSVCYMSNERVLIKVFILFMMNYELVYSIFFLFEIVYSPFLVCFLL